MNRTFFSVEGVQERIKNSERYKLLTTQRKKNLLLDKCNTVVNNILHKNLQHSFNKNLGVYEPIPLNGIVLKQMLGNNYKGNSVNAQTILKLLIYEDIIETDGEYRYLNRVDPTIRQQQINKGYTAHSKKYNLCKEWQDKKVIQVPIHCVATEKKLDRFRKKQWNNIKAIRKYQNINRSSTQMLFNEEQGKHILETKNFETKKNPEMSKDRYTADFESLCVLNTLDRFEEFEDYSFYYLSPSLKCGRVFTTYNGIPSDFRRCLRLKDGSQLAEVDKKASQPFFISADYLQEVLDIQKSNDAYIYIKEIENRIILDRGSTICDITFDKIVREASKLFNLCLNGNFYKEVAEHCKKEGSPKLHRLFEEDYAEFKSQLLGYGLYNGNKHTGTQFPLKKAHAFERHLYEMFPFFMAYVRKMKSEKGYKSVSIKATTKESKIFIDGVFDTLEASRRDFVAVPVHDALIVRVDEAEEYREMLYQLIKREYKSIFDIYARQDNYGRHLKAEKLFRVTPYL